MHLHGTQAAIPASGSNAKAQSCHELPETKPIAGFQLALH
jgi:hypothetical protein